MSKPALQNADTEWKIALNIPVARPYLAINGTISKITPISSTENVYFNMFNITFDKLLETNKSVDSSNITVFFNDIFL